MSTRTDASAPTPLGVPQHAHGGSEQHGQLPRALLRSRWKRTRGRLRAVAGQLTPESEDWRKKERASPGGVFPSGAELNGELPEGKWTAVGKSQSTGLGSGAESLCTNLFVPLIPALKFLKPGVD